MSEVKHTPGPWRACRMGECQCGMIWSTPVDQQIVTAYGNREHGAAEFVIAGAHSKWGDAPNMVYGVVPEAEREANARLIAAAPELYEAVQRAIRHAINIGIDHEGSSYFRQLTAAIAKAEGLS